MALISNVLSDRARLGTSNYFSTEQVVQIVALACESPQASGYPVSHWTPTELAAEAIKRGIVEKISPRSVGRFLRMKLLYNPIVTVTGSMPILTTLWNLDNKLPIIECWFSILMRRLLKRGNFTSTQDLKQKILDFIAYYNRTFAKPFQWKFNGFPKVG